MTFEEWKQKNYKMWNTEQAYMLACEGTPEEENAVDKYSKMIFEAAQPKWTLCKDGKNPDENQRVNAIIKSEIKKNPLYVDTVVYRDGNYINERMCHFEDVIAWMPLPDGNNANG